MINQKYIYHRQHRDMDMLKKAKENKGIADSRELLLDRGSLSVALSAWDSPERALAHSVGHRPTFRSIRLPLSPLCIPLSLCDTCILYQGYLFYCLAFSSASFLACLAMYLSSRFLPPNTDTFTYLNGFFLTSASSTLRLTTALSRSL